MPSRRVAAELNAGTYYLTLTVQQSMGSQSMGSNQWGQTPSNQ